MSDEPKACAHCGGDHVVEEWKRQDDRWRRWRVTCDRCGMRTDWHGTREAAIAAWNQRADKFGADDDYERRMDELLCRLTNGKWSKSRSYSVDFMVSCVDEAYDEILDPPVESHYAPQNTRADDAPETTMDNEQADSREELEADVYQAAEEMDYFYNGERFINTHKIIGWLDRQAAITRAEVFDDGEYDCRTCGAKRELQERVDNLEAERDKLLAELEAYSDFEKAEFAIPLDEAMQFTTDPPGYIKKHIAELQAERDQLDRDLTAEHALVTQFEHDNEALRDTAKKLTAERDQLREQHGRQVKTIERLNAQLDAAKTHEHELHGYLVEKQRVVEIQRDSFLKLERENRELQDVCGELERTVENMRGD